MVSLGVMKSVSLSVLLFQQRTRCLFPLSEAALLLPEALGLQSGSPLEDWSGELLLFNSF